jgi:multiple sugar transport system substrate-binding protein
MTMPKNKTTSSVLAVAVLAFAATAATPQVKAAEACTEVKVMASAGPESDVVAKYAKEDFEKSTRIAANIDTVARDIQAQRETAEFVDDAGQYDVIFTSGEDKLWAGRAHTVDMRNFLPASDIAKLLPQLRDLATMDDGKLMAIPQYWNAPMYFYRKDLFNDPKNKSDFKTKYGYDLGPPQTWDQLADIADFFNRPPNLYGGFVDGIAWASLYDYYNVLFGLGGALSNLKDNTLLLDSPQSVKALSIIQRLSKVSPPGFQTQSFFEADKLMQGGKLAAYWNWSYIWTTLAKSPDKYAMASTPGPGIMAGGFWWAVPQKAPHPECARKFISWLLSDDFQIKQMLATGNPPATTSVANNQEATSKIPDFGAYLVTGEKIKLENVSWARELGEGVSSAVADVQSGKKTPEQAADWLQNVKFKGRKPIE